jgi:hypothetical protein
MPPMDCLRARIRSDWRRTLLEGARCCQTRSMLASTTRSALPSSFAIIVTCRDETQQVKLLGRFHGERLECRALVS